LGDFVETIETPLGLIKFEAVVRGKAEMRIQELPCILSNGMTLDRVVACLLVVEPEVDNADLAFSAHLDNEYLAGSPESGECLDCLSWESAKWAVSIGTEDGETLSQRLRRKDLESDAYPINYTQTGLELRLTALERGKAFSFHFIVAYKRLPDDRECSTWFAVDVAHQVASRAMYATIA
jgi:hypothetical protein